MTKLTHYNAARRELAAARSIDEVREIRNRAAALKEYAKQAKDLQMVGDATEIKKRAERRGGEILDEMKASGERHDQGGQQGAEGAPPTLKELGIGTMESTRWRKLSAMSAEEFEAHVAEVRRSATRASEMTHPERVAEKKKVRAEKEAALAAKIRALPSKRYGLIYADPAWEFTVWEPETGSDRAAANHYAVSKLAAIKGRDVQSIAADDCVLALWATVPMLPEALEVMEAWGFTYKSHCAWLKDRAGTGYWFRNIHELLLIGTRGEPVAPAMGTQWESAWDAKVREHSQKPVEAYEMLEQYFPNIPKIELDAREARDGWDRHGAESPVDMEAAE